jgi:hypothetical protein
MIRVPVLCATTQHDDILPVFDGFIVDATAVRCPM